MIKNRQIYRDAVRKLEYDKQIRKFEDEIEQDFDFNDLDIKLLMRKMYGYTYEPIYG